MRKIILSILVLLVFCLPAIAQVSKVTPTILLKDEGTSQGKITELNCVGTGVACSVSGTTGTANITSGGGSGTITTVGDITSGDAGTASLPLTFLYLKNAVSGSIKLQTVTGALGSRTISFPAETGTVCTTGSVCSGYQASGSYLTSVTADTPLSGSGTSGSHLVIANAAADGSTKGAAAFNSTNFSASSGVVNTIQGISTSASPTFTGLTISGLTASTPIVANGSKALTSGSYSGNTTKLVTTTGTLTSGNCAKWDASGNIIDSGGTCGGSGGTPGGADTNIQSNDVGSFYGDDYFTRNKTSKTVFIGAISENTSALTLGVGTDAYARHYFDASDNYVLDSEQNLTISAGVYSGNTRDISLKTHAGIGIYIPGTSSYVGILNSAPLLPIDITGSGRIKGSATSIISGSIDPTASSSVTGVSTKFLTELFPGDRITVSGETRTVSSITNDTSLTVDSNFSNNANDTSVDKLWAIQTWLDSSGTAKMALNNLGHLIIGGNLSESGSGTTTQLTVDGGGSKGTVDLFGTGGGDFRIAQSSLISSGYVSLTFTSPKLGLTRSGTHFFWYDTSTGDEVWNNTFGGSSLLKLQYGGNDKLTISNTVATFSVPAVAVHRPAATSIASSATPSINTDNVQHLSITALSTAITSFTTNLSGSPTDGQKLIIRIKDDGTARAITWGSSFASRGATLPTTTVISKYLYVGLIYNSTTSTWDCVATSQEA